MLITYDHNPENNIEHEMKTTDIALLSSLAAVNLQVYAEATCAELADDDPLKTLLWTSSKISDIMMVYIMTWSCFNITRNASLPEHGDLYNTDTT